MGFTLGAGSNGIAPLTEPVTVKIGTLSLDIPTGSFGRDKKGQFKFEGTLGGVPVEARISALGGNRFELKLKARRLELGGLTNPVATVLTIGNDEGAASVTAIFDD